MRKRILSTLTGMVLLFNTGCLGQPFQFALVADTHVGSMTGQEDLERTIVDINAQPEIEFVILAGDITEFGSDAELTLAHAILLKLNKPWYIVPGNHDSKWSESGCNSFPRILGSENFAFMKNGFWFVGTASGPNMRMAPGLVPREHLLFLEGVLPGITDQPLIFINHYPLNPELANYGTVIDLLKTRNIQVSLLGHGHANRLWDFEGIPGVMVRANVRNKEGRVGYTIVTVDSTQMTFAERTPGARAQRPWCSVPVMNRHFEQDSTRWPRPDCSINDQYGNAWVAWRFKGDSDIGSGIAVSGRYAIYTNTGGEIVAIDSHSGSIIWRFATKGKIFSTPAISCGKVVCASTDSAIYCLDLQSGQQVWRCRTGKSIVASPLVVDGRIYIGSSEGVFRCIDLVNGALIWQYDGVTNFVESIPLHYRNKVYFGSWGNSFYALDAARGELVWKRTKYTNRMLSPAAVQPVAAHGKIFIVAPDRHMTALAADNGAEIWDSGDFSCRESIGIAADSSLVYIKTMQEGNLCAFRTDTTVQHLVWQTVTGAGYEIAPTPITEYEGLVFMPTTAGAVYAIDKRTRKLAWIHKLTDTVVTGIQPVEEGNVLVTTLDGTVASIRYNL